MRIVSLAAAGLVLAATTVGLATEQRPAIRIVSGSPDRRHHCRFWAEPDRWFASEHEARCC